MTKPLDFSTYKKVRAMSYNDMNRWVLSIYQSAYMDGAESTTTPTEDVVVTVDENRLMEILLSIKGIGQKRADEIIQAIYAERQDND